MVQQYNKIKNYLGNYLNSPKLELNRIVDQFLIGRDMNMRWNFFVATEGTLKIWNLFKSDVFEFSNGKKAELSFRFSGESYNLNLNGKQSELFSVIPELYPIPDSFFVTIEESGKKYEFMFLNNSEKSLDETFNFENCKKIDWIKGALTADESRKLLGCK